MKVSAPRRRASFAPDRGDAVWLELDPKAGHEQAGPRPALALSPASYNERRAGARLSDASHVKGYPFEVVLPATGRVRGAVLADQVKSLDWRMRRAQRLAACQPTSWSKCSCASERCFVDDRPIAATAPREQSNSSDHHLPPHRQADVRVIQRKADTDPCRLEDL